MLASANATIHVPIPLMRRPVLLLLLLLLLTHLLCCSCDGEQKNPSYRYAGLALDTDFTTSFIADITTRENIPWMENIMFRALTLTESSFSAIAKQRPSQLTNPIVFYSCERLAINNTQGLGFSKLTLSRSPTGTGFSVASTPLRLEGFYHNAEDPRLVSIGEQVYAIFNVNSKPKELPYFNRAMTLSPFDPFTILPLRGPNKRGEGAEKNWSPLIKNGKLLYVYSYHPLIVLTCDTAGSNEEADSTNSRKGNCVVVHRDTGGHQPRSARVRGGTNLVPLLQGQSRYYVGGVHSRIEGGNFKFYYFSHMVIVDTLEWKIVHLSKPLAFESPGQGVGRHGNDTLRLVPGTNLQMERYVNDKLYVNNIIQYPVSLVGPFQPASNDNTNKNDKLEVFFFLSVNIKDTVSLLYELRLDCDRLPANLTAAVRASLAGLDKSSLLLSNTAIAGNNNTDDFLNPPHQKNHDMDPNMDPRMHHQHMHHHHNDPHRLHPLETAGGTVTLSPTKFKKPRQKSAVNWDAKLLEMNDILINQILKMGL